MTECRSGKIRYNTEVAAQEHMKWIRKHANDHKSPVRSYPCPECKGFHLTSKESTHGSTEIKNKKFKKYLQQ